MIEIKEKHFFYCYTPFHYLLSLEIIRIEKLESASLFICNDITIPNVDLPPSIEVISSNWALFKIILRLKNKCVFYCANYKKLKSRVLAKLVSANTMISLDDGLGTRWGRGYFYENDKSHYKRLILKYLFMKPYLEFWKDSISLHYSCYPVGVTCSNKKTKFISPDFSNRIERSRNHNLEGVVILGSPLVEDGILKQSEYSQILSQVVFKSLSSKIYYYAHPRERQKNDILKLLGGDIEWIKNDGAVELFLFRSSPNIKIVGFYSSALINLKAMGYQNAYNFSTPILDLAIGDIDKLHQFFLAYNIKQYSDSNEN